MPCASPDEGGPQAEGLAIDEAEAVAVREQAALRRVLARRRLALTVDEEARIDGCQDAATLERWIEQAVDAASAADAFR
jgi:hypothetical protein